MSRTRITKDRGGSRRTALVWGATGFVLGAVFWHFVGFWSFVADVVFKDGEPRLADSAPPPPAKIAPRSLSVTGTAPRVVAVAPDACSSLVRDASVGETHAEPCSEDAAPLRLVATQRRTDRDAVPPPSRAPAVADWSARIEPADATTASAR